MKPLIYFGITVLFLTIFFFCKEPFSIEKWKIDSTSILVTSDPDDKVAFYKACKNKDVILLRDSFFFNTNCLFGENIKGKYSPFKEIGYNDLSNYFDNDRLMSLISSSCVSKKFYLLSTVSFKLSDGTVDSCSLIANDSKSKMIIFYNPYVLSLVPESMSSSHH